MDPKEGPVDDIETNANLTQEEIYVLLKANLPYPPRPNVTKPKPKLPKPLHYKSTGNIYNIEDIGDSTVQHSLSNIDISKSIKVPIVGYEVVEERARFTIYKLKVEDERSKERWLVFRRYTDFARLYTNIQDKYPNLVLPLPGKRWFRDNFDSKFLDGRVVGLQKFIDALIKEIPSDPMVKEFLCLDEPSTDLKPEVRAMYDMLFESIRSLTIQLEIKNAELRRLEQQKIPCCRCRQ